MSSRLVPVIIYSDHTFNAKTPKRYEKTYSVVCTKNSDPEKLFSSLDKNWPNPQHIEAIIVTKVGDKNKWGDETAEEIFSREKISKFRFNTRLTKYIDEEKFPNHKEILSKEYSKAVYCFLQAIFTNEKEFENIELHVIINDPEDIERDLEKYNSCRCGRSDCRLRGSECKFMSKSDDDDNDDVS